MDLIYPACLKDQRKYTKKVNPLYSVVETSVNEGSEMVFNHPIHPLNQDRVLRLKKVMTRVSPLFNRLLDEPPGDNKWIIIGEFSRFRPAPHLSGRIVDEDRFNSPQRHVHNLVDVDSRFIRAHICFLCRKECRWLVIHPLPGFVRPEVGSGLPDSILELYV